MTDRDEATGQFVPSEPKFGIEGVEIDQGYVPRSAVIKKEQPEEYGSDDASLWELAESLTPTSDEPVKLVATDDAGNPVPENESVTVDQAADDYANYSDANRAALEAKDDADIAAAVDAARAEALKNDPNAAQIYGFELPKTDEAKIEKPATDAAEPAGRASVPDGELDPQLEAALNNPQVRAALEAEVAEIGKAKEAYAHGIKEAGEFALVGFLDQFPEFATIPRDQWQTAAILMSQQNPQRAQQVAAYVNRCQNILHRTAELNAHQAQQAERDFAEYAKAEDAKVNAIIPKMDGDVMAEIRASLKESGIELAEFDRLSRSDRTLRSAFAQKTMYEAAQWRLHQRAMADYKKQIEARKLPPVAPRVQRPGVALTRGDRAHASLGDLEAKLSRSGSVDDAFALYSAQKAARR
ncbi:MULTISPECIES: hypothetical protein [Bradyrhizobium]|uniref:hypothetical protein n=1 Tax=Bradyrhizobium TaxID=374 RepID=UPI0020A22B21|nr:hypothetical protein [Bradyrhizobium elkanii]MCP1969906.1 hypothetical protein [Bradyrhizobium elkanii]MCS4108586.1 hypothetical protein [Bradyrhizobium elkanii]